MLTARLLELTAVVSRLHEVCPWTKAQTVKEMLAFTRGELAEVEGAIVGVDAASRVELVEAELGDVLFDVLMLIETCSKEHGTGGLDAVCARSIAKLRGRAPYAFEGGPTIQTAEDAELFWQAGKAAEHAARAKPSTEQGPASGPSAEPATLIGEAASAAVASVGLASIDAHADLVGDAGTLDGLDEWHRDLARDLQAPSDDDGWDDTDEEEEDGRRPD